MVHSPSIPYQRRVGVGGGGGGRGSLTGAGVIIHHLLHVKVCVWGGGGGGEGGRGI